MKSTCTIKEYGSFIIGKRNGEQVDIGGVTYTTLTKATFEKLESFILNNKDRDNTALELLGLSAKKGLGKVITAKSYIGVLTLKDGTTIEILPKIYSKAAANEQQVKKLIVRMLQTLRESPYKTLQTTNMSIEKMDILEIFISMFIDEMFLLVKRGIKSSYEGITANESFFKGKLLFSEQIKHNYAHKERAFVAYDVFNNNGPENRLLKSAILKLYKQTTATKNKADLKLLLNVFAEVPPSADYAGDWQRVVTDRNTRAYTKALLWSKIFLMGNSFTFFLGSDVALALLFPMEVLFESYVAKLLQRQLGTEEFRVSLQDKRHHLFTQPKARFLLKPDIVVERKSDGAIFICDTKWKLLDEKAANYGISPADMYQMYAYQKKYSARSVTLLYPLTERVAENNITYKDADGALVQVRFIDLFDVQNSLRSIIKEFFE